VTEPLRDADEELLRQVHPSFVDGGRITSQAFRPKRNDDGKLSVDRGSIVSPEESLDRYKFDSAGVWAVTVEEVEAEDLRAYPDPLPANDAHAVIDFAALSKSRMRAVGAQLSRVANARGALLRRSPAPER